MAPQEQSGLFQDPPPPLPDGVRYYPRYFDETAQQSLVTALRGVIAAAPLFTPLMPKTGQPFSVRMSNCGVLGWVSDRAGYRYQPQHPETGQNWPAMPEILVDLWQSVAEFPAPAEACLINYYKDGARMGLHQDRDEETFDAPVVSVSLGDTAVFRIGGRNRKDPTQSLRLTSGDVLLFGGASRLAYHGIDRVIKGSSTLLKDGGRLNLTLRRVTKV
jgi:alkylated DNA repair protein (DNA oxidative demethylase)